MTSGEASGGFLKKVGMRQFVLLGLGGLLNALFVTLGFVGAFGLSLGAAIAGVTALIAVQFALLEGGGQGFVLGLFGKGLYALFFLLDVLLAAAGLTVLFGADMLGRSFFANSVAAPVAAIRTVERDLSRFSTGMNQIASHSDERMRVEIASGNTCAPSPRGVGNYSRLREDDAASSRRDAAYVSELSGRARGAQSDITAAVAAYRVDRHDKTIKAISDALGVARSVADDPRLASIRASIALRSRQVAAGRPDRDNPSVLVHCPRDTALPALLSGALAIPAPAMPGEFTLPGVPDERASVTALIAELTRGVTGGDMDLGPWTLSLGLAPVPDLLFIYGVAVHRRRRRYLRTLFGGISDQMRLPHEDLYRAFQDAAQDARYVRLQSWHFVWQRWFLRVHCLAVPITDVVGCNLAAKLADAQLAFDAGVALGDELPGRPHGFDEAQRFHLYTLRPTVCSRLETDAVRSAMEDPTPSTPPPASAASKTAANQGEAA